MRKVYSGELQDRIRILNCPHCKSVMIPNHKGDYFEYFCFECNVKWNIKLTGEIEGVSMTLL